MVWSYSIRRLHPWTGWRTRSLTSISSFSKLPPLILSSPCLVSNSLPSNQAQNCKLHPKLMQPSPNLIFLLFLPLLCCSAKSLPNFISPASCHWNCREHQWAFSKSASSKASRVHLLFENEILLDRWSVPSSWSFRRRALVIHQKLAATFLLQLSVIHTFFCRSAYSEGSFVLPKTDSPKVKLFWLLEGQFAVELVSQWWNSIQELSLCSWIDVCIFLEHVLRNRDTE